jgi:hypothetical protein
VNHVERGLSRHGITDTGLRDVVDLLQGGDERVHMGRFQFGHDVAVDAGSGHAVGRARDRPPHEMPDPELSEGPKNGLQSRDEIGRAHVLRAASSARSSRARSSP